MRAVAERSLRRVVLGRVVLVGVLLLVASCSSLTVEPPQANREDNPRSRITGDGINLFALGGSRSQSNSGGGALGVNSFLWRASLDTVAFMPLTAAGDRRLDRRPGRPQRADRAGERHPDPRPAAAHRFHRAVVVPPMRPKTQVGVQQEQTMIERRAAR